MGMVCNCTQTPWCLSRCEIYCMSRLSCNAKYIFKKLYVISCRPCSNEMPSAFRMKKWLHPTVTRPRSAIYWALSFLGWKKFWFKFRLFRILIVLFYYFRLEWKIWELLRTKQIVCLLCCTLDSGSVDLWHMLTVLHCQCSILPMLYTANALYCQCSILPMLYTANALYCQCSTANAFLYGLSQRPVHPSFGRVFFNVDGQSS
jgi:hypothetical protein